MVSKWNGFSTTRTTQRWPGSLCGLPRLVLFVLVVSIVPCSWGEVIELTDKTFEHQTQASTGQTTGKWFVKFHTPWCGHCKKLAPIWDELSTKLAAEHPGEGIILAQVDMTNNPDSAERFQIRAYPTLKYFADRKMYTYKGPRTLDDMSRWVIGGYKKEKPEPVPSPPGWMDQQIKTMRKLANENNHVRMIIEDFEHILDYRKNAAVVLMVMGAFVGFILGCILGSMRGGRTRMTKAKED